ncbi:MAG: DUF3861 domain-containing protein [Bacteroides sp.]|nr:DUF3861 domain-containing protein [Bacteroides sp.]
MEHKDTYTYHVSLCMTEGKESYAEALPPIETDFGNHDNIYHIIEKLKEKELFNSEEEVKQFAIGLKMFSGVMLRNKNSDLFRDFQPTFVAFMKKLKGR